MNDLLWPRALAAFGVDTALALLVGVLLANVWLGHGEPSGKSGLRWRAAGLRLFSLLLALAASLQLLFLAVSFSEQTAPAALLRAMPDVCSTHAGMFSLLMCVVAVALCLAAWLASARAQQTISIVLVFAALCLHADMGHAASGGNLSISPWLQFAHLLGMAVWSGGVIVSGLFVVPRLQPTTTDEAQAARNAMLGYLARLSFSSTWAVGLVLVTGLVKAYLATGANLHLLRSTPWGNLLAAKSALVGVTVLLGARNRLLLATSRRQNFSPRTATQTLRLESIAMLGVLLLSAWLANTQPPLE